MQENQLNELYRDVVISHNRQPYNYCESLDCPVTIDAANRMCGDLFKIGLHLDVDSQRITKLEFSGDGCAISKSSISIMCHDCDGMTFDEFHQCYDALQLLVDGKEFASATVSSDLFGLSGVKDYPTRRRCVTLGWEAVYNYIEENYG
jgi:nitrogen fixation NifU-like protein